MLADIPIPTVLPCHLGTRVLYLEVDRVAGRFLTLQLVSGGGEKEKQYKLTHHQHPSPLPRLVLHFRDEFSFCLFLKNCRQIGRTTVYYSTSTKRYRVRLSRFDIN